MKSKLAYLGLFSAVAIIFGYVESLIPFFMGIPGIKLGLANLAVLFLLQKYSVKEAALVSVVRILVIGFMFGNLFSILYSLAGAFLSLTVMTLMIKKTDFSLIGVSVAGGIAHNVGQLIIAMLTVSSLNLIYYAPALLISGVITGIVIGKLTEEVAKRIPPEHDSEGDLNYFFPFFTLIRLSSDHSPNAFGCLEPTAKSLLYPWTPT